MSGRGRGLGKAVLVTVLVAFSAPARSDPVVDCQHRIEDGAARYAKRLLAAVARCARRKSPLTACLDAKDVGRTLARARAQWAKDAAPTCAGVDLKGDLGYFATCGVAPSPCTFASGTLDAPGDQNDLLDCLACRLNDALRSAGTALFAGQPATTRCHRAIARRGLKVLGALVAGLHDCVQSPGAVSVASCMAAAESGPVADLVAAWRAAAEHDCAGVDPFMTPGYPVLCSGMPPGQLADCPARSDACSFAATRNLSTKGDDDDLLDCLTCRVEEGALAFGRDVLGANPCCTGDGCATVETRAACRQAGGGPAYYRIDSLADGQTCGAHGLTVTPDGTVYLAGSRCGEVRTVTPGGVVSTFADTIPYFFSTGIAVDPAGNAFVTFRCDHVVLRITPSGQASVIAGTGTPGHSGDGGPATAADIIAPDGIALDGRGNVYITESGLLAAGGCFQLSPGPEHIRAIDAAGIIRSVAGTGAYGTAGEGGPALDAQLAVPYGLSFAPDGSYLIGETGAQRVLRVDPSGTLTRVAGRHQNVVGAYSGDGGPATAARFYEACGLVEDAQGQVFVADMVNNRIRLVDRLGSVVTIAGNGLGGFGGTDVGVPGVLTAAGCPEDIALGPDGRVYFSDLVSERVGVLTLQRF